MSDWTHDTAVTALPQVIEKLADVRVAYNEVLIAQQTARTACLSLYVDDASMSVAEMERRIELEVAKYTGDRLRKRAEMDYLVDQRDFLLAVISSGSTHTH